MHVTISKRQSMLYEKKGLDLATWQDLVEEGNRLRREIRGIAEEYDVSWDEKEDAKSQRVIEALEREGGQGNRGKRERKGKRGKREEIDEEDEDEDGEVSDRKRR